MTEKAERVCAGILGGSLALDLLLVLAIEGGSLTGVAAGIAVAVVLLLQIITLAYIKTKSKGRE